MNLTSPDFTREIRDIFEAMDSPRALLCAASHLQKMKNFADVWEFGVPQFRSRMKELWPEHKRHSVVCVDLDNIVHSSWHVRGEDTEHPLKMLRNIYKAVGVNKDTSFIVAHDLNGSKRRDVAGYKAERKPNPDEFYRMYDTIKKTLKDKGVQVEAHDGFEADDVMASCAFRSQLLDTECVLVTTDKDIFQVLGKGTAIYNQMTHEWRNVDWLKQEYLITPAQMVDWVTLVGGKNDIPGCDHIGKKRASTLLQAWGDVPNIYANRETLPPKQREAITEFFEKHYWTIKEIHTVSKEVPVCWGPQ